jgi:NAD(P)-dependent dehydrogenase (short-subunit alcohol dehydrogenase family)
MENLRGKTAVVLGCSAPGGSGWAIAEALAGAGASLIVAARPLEPLRLLADRINGRAMKCDAGCSTQVAALAATARKAFGKIDIAVNAAGLPIRGLIAESDDVMLQRALDVCWRRRASA